MSKHRVVIEFGDGVWGKLVCPDDGSCSPASTCSECHRQLDDPDTKPCYDCREPTSDECWVKSWFDNCTLDELLHGKVTVEIDPEWDGDTMLAHIADAGALEGRDR